MTTVSELSRPQMLDAARGIHKRLVARKKKGPKEDALDAYIPEFAHVVTNLDTHTGGTVLADAARKARLARSEKADSDVDTWLRHHESYVSVEAGRRVGPNVAAAKALQQAAFKDGLAHVDDPIPVENPLCRASIAVLRSPEHAATVSAIGLPTAWIAQWEAALDESDAAFAEVQKARAAKSAHVGGAQDAETDFVDVAVRLRRYVASRAARTNKAKLAEGKELLAPLLDALKKSGADKAARATRRNGAKAPAAPAASPADKPPPA